MKNFDTSFRSLEEIDAECSSIWGDWNEVSKTNSGLKEELDNLNHKLDDFSQEISFFVDNSKNDINIEKKKKRNKISKLEREYKGLIQENKDLGLELMKNLNDLNKYQTKIIEMQEKLVESENFRRIEEKKALNKKIERLLILK